MFNYDDVKKKVFYWDGSWRDIYVLHTDIQDWEKLYSFFVADYRTIFSIDSEVVEVLPQTVKEIFDLNETSAPVLGVLVGDIHLCIHFFSEREFEADIDPRQVKNENDVTKLLNFIRKIGILLHKDVILTGENTKAELLLTYNHVSEDFVWSY